MSLFREKLLYLAKGADICVFAGSLPRGVDDKLYAELIVELKRLGVMTVIDTEGEPMDLALRAGPDLVSPNSMEAEELVGHEFRDDEDQVYALYELCERGPREAIITHEEGCYALVGRDHERRSTSSAPSSSSRSRRSARATSSWPATSPRATPAARTGMRCASRSPAAPSRRSTSAPACWTRAPSSGSSTRSS